MGVGNLNGTDSGVEIPSVIVSGFPIGSCVVIGTDSYGASSHSQLPGVISSSIKISISGLSLVSGLRSCSGQRYRITDLDIDIFGSVVREVVLVARMFSIG